MKTSIATVSISGELPEKLAAISAAGFDGIEIFEQDFVAHDGSPRDVAERVRDHGLEIMLFQPFRDFEGLPEPDRSRAFDRAKRKFDIMQELGTDLMLICSSVHPNALGGIDRAADDLHELGDIAASRGLRIGYEALAWGKHINDHRDAWEIVRRADHSNVGLIVDSFHTLGRRLSPESIRAIPGDKIFFVQLADAPQIDMDLLYWSRHFRNMPGEGDLDITAFMRAVAATGYHGPISLEIFNDQFRSGRPASIALDGHRSLLALMDDVNRSEGAPSMNLPRMPARPDISGFEFLEFSTDEDDAERLGQVLGSMGFRRSGQHINKAVSLWQQGDIRIIINTEPDGFAHASYLAHGTSVCDIGLHVDSAHATVERAKQLRLPSFDQPVSDGELDLPAIRSVGHSVLHFVDRQSGLDRVWDVEFEPVDITPETDCGLVSVDHVAQSMDYDEMLTWALFYTSLFNLKKQPIVDVVDPGGLIRSMAIESPDQKVRMTLNGVEAERTLAGHFVAQRSGSAVQHLALATDDIFETASRLLASGFIALPLPDNYYSDVQARFGLDDDFVDRLKRFSILYDEEGTGQFFQIYSKPIGDGFFFEIVQRVNGYGGYGAANAPYRTAALKRLLRQMQIGEVQKAEVNVA
ncbi:MAG: sugar phosphate isomerase/epimerase and 4-hydroxyphenylpyruvate domain-containing protein [Alphaproteobacteria bacterium]|nr:sugar phosphate isomerase/epimerase and 4-hydroxyphenylpyruvate domain-containing protein [Alphaproteobacteria bacterium]